GVVREPGLDLERHEPVRVVGLLPDAPEHVARELHVEDRDLVVDLARRQPFRGELGDLLVVVRRAQDRLLEDGRIRRDTAQRQLALQAPQLAGRDEAAPDLVQPDARPRGGQRRKPFVNSCSDAHLGRLLSQVRAETRSTTARARSATFSGVKPKCSSRAGWGAAAPNVVMPIASPSSPTHVLQPRGEAASTETRARTSGGRTLSRESRACSAKRSRQGAEATPPSPRAPAPPTQMGTSEPVPIRIRSASPLDASRRT